MFGCVTFKIPSDIWYVCEQNRKNIGDAEILNKVPIIDVISSILVFYVVFTEFKKNNLLNCQEE